MAHSDRSELTKRQLPHMNLGTLEHAILNAPVPDWPAGTVVSAEQRAYARFAVSGTAVITGGAGNLALVTARALLEHGLSGLALLDLDPEGQSGDEIRRLREDFPYLKIVTAKCDVTSFASLEKAFADVSALFASQAIGSQINLLLTFAGVVSCVHAKDMPESEWRRVLDVNLTGTYLTAKAAFPHMCAKSPTETRVSEPFIERPENSREPPLNGRGGVMTFIASMSGHVVNFPQPQAAYNVSKTGVQHLARNLATEWAYAGIRVNSISPGYMDTVLNEGEGLEASRKIWIERCPLGRMGDPEELAGVCVMLSSKKAGGYITGADIRIDGGTTVF